MPSAERHELHGEELARPGATLGVALGEDEMLQCKRGHGGSELRKVRP